MSDNMSYPEKYLEKLSELINKVEVTDSKRKKLTLDDAINKILSRFKVLKKNDNKVIFIGNGGSAGICSHQSVDYWKNGKIPAIAFNDSSLLTCISNDYGYEYVFEKPINMFAKKGDALIAISSSGKSKNIIKGAEAAKKKGVYVITMSGFLKTNPLRKKGDMNFYVSSETYGHVEISHLILSHIFLDTHLKTKL
jgi:D-sedoheptulose 7-phosphate isomerase